MAGEDKGAAPAAAPEKTAATDQPGTKTAIDTAAADKGGDKGRQQDQGGKETIAAGGGSDKEVSLQADWPADWRQKLAGDDAKKLKQLERYTDPAALAKKTFELEQKLSSGESRDRKPLAEGATDEEKAAWRKDNGVHEKAELFVEQLELPKGVVLGEADKPVAASFAKTAFDQNWDQRTFNGAVAWYYQQQDEARAAQEAADDEYKQQSDDALHKEWGPEYRRNLNAISNMLAQMPDDMHLKMGDKVSHGGMLLAARLPNGRLLGDHPAFVKWLAAQAIEANPTATLVPAGTADPQKHVEGRLAEIKKIKQDTPDKYDSDRELQAEELRLITARDKTGKRSSRAA